MEPKRKVEFIVENATLKDFERIKELLVQAELNVNKENFKEEKFAKALEHFGRYYLVARSEGKIIGFVSGFDDGAGLFGGYLGRLTVDKDFRDRGVGTELLKLCLRRFKESGVNSVIAGVRDDNHASRKILERVGFEGGDHFLLYNELRD